MSDYERGALGSLDDAGDGESLTATGNPEQHLVLLTIAQAAHQRVDCLRLVATGLVVRFERERHKH